MVTVLALCACILAATSFASACYYVTVLFVALLVEHVMCPS